MKHFWIAVWLLIGSSLSAQTDKTSIWVAAMESDSPDALKFAKEARTEIMESFVKFGSFSVVDRDATDLIKKELELQKTEAFMDGKVVEQGKAVGAEYIARSWYQAKEGKFIIKIIEVASGNTIETDEYKMDFFAANYKKHLRKMVYRLSNRWLSGSKITVLRSLEDKSDATQRVLLAGGTAKGLKVGMQLEVFIITTEEVDGEQMERFEPVGKIKVDRIENANFSNARVRSGEKEIFKLFAAKQKVYCRILQN